MSIALVFSGQGAQYVGMGKSLYDASEHSRKVFDTAGEEIKRLCFSSTEEELAQTHNTQPCIYTMSMAAYTAFKNACRDKNISFDMMAGFSLGEYSALAAAGVFSFSDGLNIVTRRGNWMHKAGSGKGSMCAVLGDLDKVKTAINSVTAKGVLEAVNFNCPGQTVVAGENEALSEFSELALNAGLKVVSLKVGGPFHSSLMKEVSLKLKELLQTVNLSPPEKSVYSNVTGEVLAPEDMIDLISKQVMSPVLWEKTIRKMISNGADTFIEIGPGKTLCGMIRRIDRSVKTLNIEDIDSLNSVIEALNNK